MDKNNLPLGTRVRITEGPYGAGTTGIISRSYTIRFGHRMYDITTAHGHTYTYYGPAQLEVL
jgi:hypothetical protein